MTISRRTCITGVSAAAGLGMMSFRAGDCLATKRDEARSQSTQGTLLIKNGMVVPMDGRTRSSFHTDVLVKAGRIAKIGNSREWRNDLDGARTIDASGKAVLPGFVNCHVHTLQTGLLRGLAEDIVSDRYMTLGYNTSLITGEDAYYFALLATLEMLKFGNTCVNELPYDVVSMEPTAQAYHDLGIRGIVAPDVSDIAINIADTSKRRGFIPSKMTSDAALKKRRFDEAERLLKKWHANENTPVGVRLSNFVPSQSTLQNLVDTKRLADQYRTGVNAHAGSGDQAIFRAVHGLEQMAYLADCGWMDENAALVHMSAITAEEAAIVRNAGAWIIHCPWEMAKGGALPPTDLFYDGMRIAYGNDWLMMCPFNTMRQAITLARVKNGGHGRLSAYDFLEMMTLKGAQAMGLGHEIGSIEVGKRADMILIDCDVAHMSPMTERYDIIRTIVYNAQGSDVSTVIVDGCVVVENKVAVRMDEKQVIAECSKRAVRHLDRLGL